MLTQIRNILLWALFFYLSTTQTVNYQPATVQDVNGADLVPQTIVPGLQNYRLSGVISCIGCGMTSTITAAGSLLPTATVLNGFLLNGIPFGGCSIDSMSEWSCTFSNPASTASFSLLFSVSPSQGSQLSALIQNSTFVVTGGNTDLDSFFANIEAQSDIQLLDLQATTTGLNSSELIAGETLILSGNVLNAGPSDADDIDVLFELPVSIFDPVLLASSAPCTLMGSDLTCMVAPALTVGSQVPFSVTLGVNPNVPRVDTSITVTATSAEVDLFLGNNTQDLLFFVSRENDLLTMISAPLTATAGTGFNKTISVTNNGPSLASNLDVVVSFAAFADIVVSAPLCALQGQTFICGVSSLAPMATTDFVFTIEILPQSRNPVNCTATAIVENTVGVSDPNPTNDVSMASTTVLISSDLEIVDLQAPSSAVAGESITYITVIRNNGPSSVPPASSMFDFLSDPNGQIQSVSCGSLPCINFPLDPLENATVTVQFFVFSNTTSANISATSTISGNDPDPISANNAFTLMTPVLRNVDLAIMIPTQPTQQIIGTSFEYPVVLMNNGPSDSVDFLFTQEIPSQFIFVNTTAPGCNFVAPDLTCVLSLVTGDSISFMSAVLIPSNTLAETNILANAFVNATNENEQNFLNDQATFATDISIEHDLQIALAADLITVIAGENLIYTVTVTNNGPSDARNISFAYNFDAGLTIQSSDNLCSFNLCSNFDITSGMSRDFIFLTSVASTQLNTLSSMVSNTMSTPLEADPNAANNAASLMTFVDTRADVSISAVTSAPSIVTAGTTLNYNVSIANVGPSLAREITLLINFDINEMSFASGMNCVNVSMGLVNCSNIADIDANAPDFIQTLSFNVNSATRDNLTADFTAVSITQDDFPSNNNATLVNPVDTLVELSLSLDNLTGFSGMNPIAGQDSVVYQFRVTNNGPSDATSIVLTNQLDAGVTFDAMASSPFCTGNTTLMCNVGTIPAGDFLPVIVAATVNAETRDSINNTAFVSSIEPESFPADNVNVETTTVDTLVDLTLVLTPPATVVAGEEFIYELFIQNAGPSYATDVLITIQENETEINFLSDSLGLCSAFDADTIVCNLGVLDFTPVTFNVTANTTSSTRDTISLFSTATTADPDVGANTSNATIPVLVQVDLAFDFAASNASVIAGNELDFAYTVINRGPSDSTLTEFSVFLDPSEFNLASLSVTSVSFCALNSNTLTCQLGTLIPLQTEDIAFSIQVLSSNRNPSVNVTASVSSTDGVVMEQNPADDSVSLVSTIVISADLVLTVTPFSMFPVAGSVTGFLYQINNNGPSDAINITLFVDSEAQAPFLADTAGSFMCNTPGGDAACDLALLPVNTAVVQYLFFQTSSDATTLSYTTTLSSPDDSTDTVAPQTLTLARQTKFEVTAFTDQPDPVNAGDLLFLNLTAINFGPSDTDMGSLVIFADAGAPLTSFSGEDGFNCDVMNAGCDSMVIAPNQPVTVNFTLTTNSSLDLGSTLTSSVSLLESANVACGTVFSDFMDWIAFPSLTLNLVDTDLSGDLDSPMSTQIATSAPIYLVDSPSTERVELSFNIDFTLGEYQRNPMGVTDLDLFPFIEDPATPGSFFTYVDSSVSGSLLLQLDELPAGETIEIVVFRRLPSGPLPAMVTLLTADGVINGNIHTASTTGSVDITVSAGAPFIVQVIITNRGSGPCVSGLAAEITNDFGATWMPLVLDLPYVQDNQWCGTLTASLVQDPQLVTADLSSFVNDVIQIRFVLETGNFSATAGNPLVPDFFVSDFSLDYVCSTGPVLQGSNATVSTTVTTQADLEVTIFESSPDPAVAGETLSYTFRVSNNGPSFARNVSVSIPFDSRLDFLSSDSLACTDVGDQLNCQFPVLEDFGNITVISTFVIDCNATGNATTNIAVSSETFDPNTFNNGQTEMTLLERETAFSVSFDGMSQVFSDNGPVSYLIGVNNTGPSAGTDVLLSFTLDSGVVNPMLSAGSCNFSAPNFVCLFGEISCNTTNVYTLTVDIPLETTASVSHSLVLTGDLGAEDPSDNSASFSQFVNQIDLDIVMNGNIIQRPIGVSTPGMNLGDPGIPGEQVELLVTVANNGPAMGLPLRNATDVTFVLSPDPNLMFLTASLSMSCTNTSMSDITCDLPEIEGNTSFVFSLFFLLDPNVINNQTISSVAQVSGAEVDINSANDVNNFDFRASTVSNLTITITTSQTIETIGDFIDYTIVFSNEGPSTANNVFISHSHPPSTLLPSEAPSATLGLFPQPAGGLPMGTMVSFVPGATWISIPQVLNGESFTFVSRVVIDPGFRTTSGMDFVNSSVSIISDEFDPSPLTAINEDSTFVRVFSDVDLTLSILPPSLRASPPTASPGETVTFNSFIINTGPSDATVVDLNYYYNSSWLTWGNNPRLNVGITPVAILCEPAQPIDLRDRIQCFLQEIPIDRNQITNGGSFSQPFQVLVDFNVVPGITGTANLEAEIQFNEYDAIVQDNLVEAQLNIGSADLSVDLSGTPSPTIAGTNISFVATVSNSMGSPQTATSVVYQQTIPNNKGEVLQVTGTNCVYDEEASLVTCNLPDLMPGATETISVLIQLAETATGSQMSTATISSDQFDPDTADRTDTATIVINDCNLVVALFATPAMTVNAGDAIVYSATVTTLATSNNTCTGVMFTQTIAPGTVISNVDNMACNVVGEQVECMLGDIAIGASQMLTITADVDPSVSAGEVLLVVATASPQEFDIVPTNNFASLSHTVEVLSDLSVSIVSDPMNIVTPGQSVDATFSVINNGPSDSSDTQLTIPLPSALTISSSVASQGGCSVDMGLITCVLGGIAFNDTVFVDITFEIAPDTTADFDLEATVSDLSVPDSDPTNDMFTLNLMVNVDVDLSVVVQGPATRFAGEFVSYFVQVNNAGPGTAAATMVNLTLDSALVSVENIFSSNGNCVSAGTPIVVSCTFAEIPTLASAFISLTVLIDPAQRASLIFSSALVSNADDFILTNNMVSFNTSIDVSNDLIVQAISSEAFIAGSTSALVFQVKNNGPSQTDPLTAALNLSPMAPVNAGFSTSGIDGVYTPCGMDSCSLPALAVGQNAFFVFEVALDSGFALDSNTSLMYVLDLNDLNDSNSPHSIQDAPLVEQISDLRLTKSAVGLSAAGDSFTYTLEVSNDGPSDSPSLMVSDTLGQDVTVMSVSAGCVFDTMSVNCTAGRLDSGLSTEFTIVVTAASNTRDLILNVASVSGPNSDPNTDNNLDFVSTEIVGTPELVLSVSPMANPVAAGGVLVYRLTVNNTGVSDATSSLLNVALPLSTALAGVISVSSPENVACSATDMADPNFVTCYLPFVAAGTVETFDVSIDVFPETIATMLSFNFTLAHPEDPQDDMETVQADIVPRTLTVSALDLTDPIAPGQTLQLNIDIGNTAMPTTDISDVTVLFDLPSNATNLVLTLSSSSNAICGQFDNTPNDSVLCHVPVIPQGMTESLSLFFEVSFAEAMTTLSFNISVDGEGLAAPITVEENTMVDPINTLFLSVDATPTTVAAGSSFSYTLAIDNTPAPNSPASNVRVLFDLPSSLVSLQGFNSTAALTACGLIDAGPTVACLIPLILSGDTETLTLTLFVDSAEQGPTLDFSFEVEATELGVMVSQMDTITIQPTSVAASVVDMDPIGAGSSLQYTLTLDNSNTMPTADLHNVEIAFDLASPSVFFRAANSPVLDVVCGVTTTNMAPAVDSVLCRIPLLAADAVETVDIVVLVSQSQPAGNITTQFTVTADGLGMPLVFSETTSILEGSVDLGITLSGSTAPLAFQDQQVTLSSDISFTGSAPPNNPEIEVTFDASLSFVSAVPNGGSLVCTSTANPQFVVCSISDNSTSDFSVEWTFDKVAEAGTYAVFVQIEDTAGPAVEDLAIPDLDLSNNQASFSAVAAAPVSLSVTSAVTPEAITIGDAYSVTVTVSNAGTATAIDALLFNTLPPASDLSQVPAGCTANGLLLECDLGDLAPAATASILLEFGSTSSPGNLTNVASVTAAGPIVPTAQSVTIATVNVAQLSTASFLSVSTLLLLISMIIFF